MLLLNYILFTTKREEGLMLSGDFYNNLSGDDGSAKVNWVGSPDFGCLFFMEKDCLFGRLNSLYLVR